MRGRQYRGDAGEIESNGNGPFIQSKRRVNAHRGREGQCAHITHAGANDVKP